MRNHLKPTVLGATGHALGLPRHGRLLAGDPLLGLLATSCNILQRCFKWSMTWGMQFRAQPFLRTASHLSIMSFFPMQICLVHAYHR